MLPSRAREWPLEPVAGTVLRWRATLCYLGLTSKWISKVY